MVNHKSKETFKAKTIGMYFKEKRLVINSYSDAPDITSVKTGTPTSIGLSVLAMVVVIIGTVCSTPSSRWFPFTRDFHWLPVIGSSVTD